MNNYGKEEVMNNYGRIILILIVIAIIIIVPIILIKRMKNSKGKKLSKYPTEPPKDSPYISVEYAPSGSLLDDGKCGWLDIECGFGGKETIALNFDKKTPTRVYIPLTVSQYRITYRSKGNAAMAATEVLKTINENNGAMGAFANAVFDAGMGNTQLSSVVVNVGADFVMKLRCSTDGMQKSCEVVA